MTRCVSAAYLAMTCTYPHTHYHLFVWTGKKGLRSSEMRHREAGCFLTVRSKVSPYCPTFQQSKQKIGQMRCSESRDTTTNERTTAAYRPEQQSLTFLAYTCRFNSLTRLFSEYEQTRCLSKQNGNRVFRLHTVQQTAPYWLPNSHNCFAYARSRTHTIEHTRAVRAEEERQTVLTPPPPLLPTSQ